MPKPKKAGRPKLPKGEAMGSVIQVRFTAQDTKAIEQAAKASNQTLSEWVRSNIHKLLANLENSNRDKGSRSNESRQIRKGLRELGHRGGLSNSPSSPESA
jgi:hypothetical protein